MAKIVSFDVGGTLLDIDGGGFCYALSQHLAVPIDRIRPLLSREALTKPCNIETVTKKICTLVGTADAELFLEKYEKPSAQIFEEVSQCLTSLQELGYKLVSFSNCTQWESGDLRKLLLGSFFEHSFYSFELGYVKPDVRAFRYVEKTLAKERHDIIHVGDSWRNDVCGAINAGWKAVFLSRKGEVENPLNNDANIIPSLNELPRLLLEIDWGP